MGILDDLVDNAPPAGEPSALDRAVTQAPVARQTIGDYARKLQRGATSTFQTAPAQIASMLGAPRTAVEQSQRAEQTITERLSPAGRFVDSAPLVSEEGGLGPAPVQTVLSAAVESAPSLVQAFVAGKPIFDVLGRARVAERVAGAAQRAGVGARTAGVVGRAAEAVPFAAVEGVQAGAMAAADMGKRVRDLSDEKLRASPAFAEAYAATDPAASPESRLAAAREVIAQRAERQALAMTGASTGTIGMATGAGVIGQFARRLAGRQGAEAAADTLLKATLKGAGAEAAQETPQSGAEQLIANLITRGLIDPNQPLTEGVLNAALTGGAAGGLLGGLGGGAGRLAQRTPGPEREPTLDEIIDSAPPAGETANPIPGTTSAFDETLTPPVDPAAGPLSAGVAAGQESGAIATNAIGGPLDPAPEPGPDEAVLAQRQAQQQEQARAQQAQREEKAADDESERLSKAAERITGALNRALTGLEKAREAGNPEAIEHQQALVDLQRDRLASINERLNRLSRKAAGTETLDDADLGQRPGAARPGTDMAAAVLGGQSDDARRSDAPALPAPAGSGGAGVPAPEPSSGARDGTGDRTHQPDDAGRAGAVGQSLTPEIIDKGGANPTPPPGPRWWSDRGVMPGEPFAFLDMDEDSGPDTATAAMREIEVPGKGVYYEVTDRDGNVLSAGSTPQEAAQLAEQRLAQPRGALAEGQAPVDIAAAQSPSSPTNNLPAPTDAQKEAGNYRKPLARIGGVDVRIENEAGTRRRPEWPKLKAHYGYVPRTEASDGDGVDVFVRPGTPDTFDGPVFVIDQVKPDGSFDEAKVMLGWDNRSGAIATYRAAYTKGWKVGPVTQMTMAEFKAWLRDGDTTKALAAQPKPKRSREEVSRERKRAYRETYPFRSFLAEHGVSVADRSDVGGERNRPVMVPYHGPLFRKTGLRLDELAWRAVEAGFLTQADIDSDLDNGGVNKLSDMIRRELAGERILPVTAAESELEAQWRAQMDARYEAMQEAEDAIVEQASDDEINALLQLASDEDAEASNEEIDYIAGQERLGGETQEGAAGDAPRGDSRGGAEARAESPGEVDDDLSDIPFDLDRQSDADVRQQEAQRRKDEAKAERGAAEQAKRDAAPPPGDFTLTGSNRPADEAAARGQQELAPTEPTQESEQAVTDERVSDSGLVHAKQFADLLERLAGFPQGFGALDVETQRLMVAAVLAPIENLKVRQAIVRLVPVDVMNDLIGSERATEAFLDNSAVLADALSSAQPEFSVSVSRFFDALREAPARVRAEVLRGMGVTKGGLSDSAATERAADGNGRDGPVGAIAGDGTEMGRRPDDAVSRLGEVDTASGALQGDARDGSRVATGTRAEIPRGKDLGSLDLEGGTAVSASRQHGSIIVDFGAKLEGARKDQARDLARAVSDDDIAGQPFSKIWPATEVDAIEDVFVAAFAHTARAAVPPKPRKPHKLKRWVEGVKMLRGLAAGVVSGEMDRVLVEDRLRVNRALEGFTAKVDLLTRLDREHWKRITGVREYPDAYTYDSSGKKVASPSVYVEIDGKTAVIDGAGRVTDDAVLGRVNTLLGLERAEKKMAFEVRGRGSSFFINKKGDPEYRALKEFNDAKEAFVFIREHHDELVALWEAVKDSDNVKKADVRRRENRQRTGADRRGGLDVTPEQFEQAFGFRGVQFGDWVGQGADAKARQGMLNQAYDALHDLAEIIGVPTRAISLNGTMGLAFGARGKGWASAHFEPDNLVINLTKTRGAGSLAHEWFHALDNYFSRMRRDGEESPFTGDQYGYRRQNYITYQPEAYYEKEGRTIRARDFEAAIAAGPLQAGASREDRRNYNLRRQIGSTDGWVKRDAVRPQVEERFAALVEALKASPMAKRASTIDKGSSDGYWSRIIELGARAFETFVIARMAQKGYHNDFLANVVASDDFVRSAERYPYPKPDELAPIEQAFDDLFGTLETRETDRGLAIFEPTAQYRVDEPQDTQADLFGVPGEPGENRRTRPNRAGVRRNVQPAATLSDTEAPAGEYFLRTVLGTETNRQLGASVITTPADAARATKYLYRNAVERFDGIVTDKNGKPLAVVGGFKGALSQASVYPATLVGEAIRVPGAARIWFSHNHPSGTAELSGADRMLHRALNSVFRGSGIEPMGLLAVAGDSYAFEGTSPSGLPGDVQNNLPIYGKDERVEVPVVERMIAPDGVAGRQIDSPAAAKTIGAIFYNRTKEPGLLLVSAQNRVVAWVPLSSNMLGKLRDTGGLQSLYRAVSESTVGGALIVHGGELSALPDLNGVSVVDNIGAALKQVDVTPLDAINVVTGHSRAEHGASLASGPVFSRGTGAGMHEADVSRVADAIRATWANGPEVVVLGSFSDAPAAVREAEARSKGATGRPEGFFHDGKVYIVASEIDSAADVVRVLAHEALGHAGLHNFFGDSLTPILQQIVAARRKEVAAKAESYGIPQTREGLLVAAEEVLAEFAETIPTLGFVKRAIAAIRTWMREHVPGMRRMHLSDDEIIRNYILPARGWVVHGGSSVGKQQSLRPSFGRRNPEIRQRMADLYRSGKTLAEVAKITGRTATTVHEHLKKAGVEMRQPGVGPSLANEDVDRLVRAYLSGRSTPDLAREFGLNASSVNNYLEKAGVARRALGPSRERVDEAIRLYKLGLSLEQVAAQLDTSGRAIYDWLKRAGLALRPRSGFSDDVRAEAVRLYSEGMAAAEVARRLGLGANGWAVRDWARKAGVARTLSESTSLAVRNGRVVYSGVNVPYQSKKTGEWEMAHSTYELLRMAQLDADQAVASWTKKVPLVAYKDANGVDRTYVPDFLVTYSDGRQEVEEVKPEFRVKAESVQRKLKAAREQLLESGITLRVLTQHDIGVDKIRDLYRRMRKAKERNADELLGNRVEPQARANDADADAVDTLGGDVPMFSRAGGEPAAGTMGQRASNVLRGLTVGDVMHRFGNRLRDLRGVSLQALGRRQIVDVYGDLLPQLRDYDDIAQQLEAEKNEGAAEADGLADRWGRLTDERALADVMHDATLAGWDPDTSRVPVGLMTPEMRNLLDRFNALTPQAKAVYRDARDAYRAHYEKVKNEITARIRRSIPASPMRAAMLEEMEATLFRDWEGVYFPLARFGEYVIVARDAGGNTVAVSRAESLNEAETVRAHMMRTLPASRGYSVGKILKSREFNAARDGVGRSFLHKLYGVLDQQGALGAELQDSINQLYLSSLPDLSWAKHGIHRKGTPGFSQDARRAFAQNMFHGARYLAKLRHSDRLADALMAMQEHVDAQAAVEDYDSVAGQQVVDEMAKRHEIFLNPKVNPWATAATSVGFVWYLGLSPASAVVNLSQTPLVAFPLMGAKWGFRKAASALQRASRETMAAGNDLSKRLQGAELDAFKRATKDGTIDITQAHDLAGIAQGEDQGVVWRMRPIMKAAAFMFHHAEKFNRQATFLAAYRLAKAANPAITEDEAYRQAKDITYRSHFDYAAGNKPRIMQGNLARVVLLFKQFAQNMIYTLARQGVLAAKGDRQAAKAFGALLTSHALAAGIFGLPLVNVLLEAASMLGSTDDEPWDAEGALRNYMAEAVGPTAGAAAAHGLSRLTPWDISGRVGLDHLIFPDVREGLEGESWAHAAAASAAGPVLNMALIGPAKGLALIADGHWLRGLEAMMPAALRSGLKSVRYATEGAQTRDGKTIVEDVGVAEWLGQAAGFSPSRVRDAGKAREIVFGLDRRINARRASLIRDYGDAVMAKDHGAMGRQREAVLRFNEANPDRPITGATIVQSVRMRTMRAAEAEKGIYLPRKRRGLVEQGRFADVE